jgi:uncharacterized membrane protein YqjE
METTANHNSTPASAGYRAASTLLRLGANRVELFALELEEERERMRRAAILAVVAAVFGVLAGVAFTVALVLLLWQYSAVLALIAPAAAYGAIAAVLFNRLKTLQREWRSFEATREQLKKDRAALESLFQ